MQGSIAVGNVLVVAVTALVTYFGFSDERLLEKGLFSSSGILLRKEYYRLVSSGFVHADWPHLLFNMFSLYSFGSYLEQIYGLPVFLLVYFGSMIGGNLLSLYLHRHHEYRAVGASGGVCGVIFASIFLLPGSSVYLFLIPVPIPAWLYAIIFIVISVRGIHAQAGNIGHEAHLGGALTGLLAATAVRPGVILQNPLLYAAVVGLSLFFLVYLNKRPLGPR